MLDAVPDFSAAPLEQGGRARQRMQQQSAQQGAGQDSPTASGPNQVSHDVCFGSVAAQSTGCQGVAGGQLQLMLADLKGGASPRPAC